MLDNVAIIDINDERVSELSQKPDFLQSMPNVGFFFCKNRLRRVHFTVFRVFHEVDVAEGASAKPPDVFIVINL